MGVDTEGIVMFVHVALVVVGLMMAAVMHTALVQLRRAHRIAEMRPWVPVVRRVEPLLPLVALAIFGSGAWLIELSDGQVDWGQGWIVASIVGLVVGEAVGAALAPRSHVLTASILDADDGLVPHEVQRHARDPRLWYGAHFITAVFFGVIFLMTAQPAGAWGPAVIVVGAAVLGVLSAIPFVHAPGRPRTIAPPHGTFAN